MPYRKISIAIVDVFIFEVTVIARLKAFLLANTRTSDSRTTTALNSIFTQDNGIHNSTLG